MKKQNLSLLLLFMLAACTDMDSPRTPAGDADARVTACILPVACVPRVSDGEAQTVFQTGDTILIDWKENTASAYSYTYSGSDGVFTPADDSGKDLWSELTKQGAKDVDVYAWYDPTSSGILPTDGSSLSVPSDQSTEASYMSGLYMAAHEQVTGAANTLDFTFRHLVSRVRLSIDFNDKSIKESDIQDAVVKMRLHATGVIGKSASKDYQWTASGTLDEITLHTVAQSQSFHLECICLIPPQSLDEENAISILLGKGKEYTCTLGKGVTLDAGQEVALSIQIKAEGIDVHAPVVTIIPKTELSSYYNNRLLCIQKEGDNYRLYVYEKQADNSWGEPMTIYESLDSNDALLLPAWYCLDIYKDYVTVGTSDSSTGQIYFCKRDKDKGKWYKASGPINCSSYAVTINEHFLVAGMRVGGIVYPIKDGNLDAFNSATIPDLDGFKVRLTDNDVLCSARSLYRLELGIDGKPTVVLIASFNENDATRASSDGRKVILQKDSAPIKIYNLSTEQYETIDNPPIAGVGLPVAIYDNYALAGGANWIVLLYYNGTKWIRVEDTENDSNGFLHLLKKYAPNETINKLTDWVGNFIVMKGTQASITDKNNGTTYFVENIDKIVEAWLADNPSKVN